MSRDTCSHAALQRICLHSLKQIKGFEHVTEILVQWREPVGRDPCGRENLGQTPSSRDEAEYEANWTLAAVRPRVDNQVLRSARAMIEWLQQTYRLEGPPDSLREKTRRQRHSTAFPRDVLDKDFPG